jgi:hypothetical protein
MDTKVSRSGRILAPEARLMADDSFHKALEQICKHARNGQKATNRSEETLLLFAYLAVRRSDRTGRTPKENWERGSAHNTGKTWKQLAEFSGRLRRIAQEVEHLRKNHYFDPEQECTFFTHQHAITAEGPLADFAKQQFRMLPATLGNYANWLEMRVHSISDLMKHFYRRTPRKHSPFIHEVSAEVKVITGRFRDLEVANLLNAADRVLNPGHQGSEDRFNEATIALLRYRQKRKTPK